MKTDFLTSGNHFNPFSQTAVNCFQWKQFFFSTGTYFFGQSFIPARENKFLSTGNSMFLFQVFSANGKKFFRFSIHFLK